MSKKRKIDKFRLAYTAAILILLITLSYFRSAVKVSRVTNSDNNFLFGAPASPSPSAYSLPSEIVQKPNSTKYTYSDKHISFEFPLDWRVSKSNPTSSSPMTTFYFVGSCGHGLGSFSFIETDKSKPNSYEIAQKNQYGPLNQVSGVTKIGSLTIGTNIQPTGDGSGGYEPGLTIDFLSNSKSIHYYFIANLGCRDTFQMTYEQDVLPVIKTVKLLD